MEFSHITSDGEIKMVNISGKKDVKRTAVAQGIIRLAPKTIALLKERTLKKGDALAAAKLAGIQAAKKTSELIPLCHNIPLSCVDVRFSVKEDCIHITSKAECIGKTGVEMEALTAVSASALTIYDMCKAVDKEMEISDIKLVEKRKEEI